MPKSKKFGGVKQKRQGETLAADVVPSPSKKVGGVKAPVPRGVGSHVESCRANCEGEWIGPTWIHSRDCIWVGVIWKPHGATVHQWRCPFDCDPLELPSGWTHPYNCPFWNETGTTPFDQAPPSSEIRDVPIQSAMESVQLGVSRDTVKAQKERMRHGQSQSTPTKKVLPDIYHGTETYPKALDDEDDELPF